MPESEHFWEQLLYFIETGSVIPVVGQELLQVEVDGHTRPLYVHLAGKLARQLEVAPKPRSSVGTAPGW